MKHIVSFETAKALKAAGYPQPEFATGQIWYNELGEKIFIGHKGNAAALPKHRLIFLVDGGSRVFKDPAELVCFYAPSATEIMEHEKMRLCVCDCYGYAPVIWNCADHESRRVFADESHPEAAAKMFINLAKNL